MSTETTETPDTPGVVQKMDPKLYPVCVLAWVWVAIPFSYGLWKLFDKIPDLF